jgi:hypothetical protein
MLEKRTQTSFEENMPHLMINIGTSTLYQLNSQFIEILEIIATIGYLPLPTVGSFQFPRGHTLVSTLMETNQPPDAIEGHQ